MKSIICPGCGNEVNGEAAFCPQCGQQLFPQGVEPVQAAAEATEPVAAEPAGAEETSLASEMVCGGCGAPVLEGAEACSNCGGTIFLSAEPAGDGYEREPADLSEKIFLDCNCRGNCCSCRTGCGV